MSGEHRVTVDSGVITTFPGVVAGTNFYTSQISDTLGVVAANNFLSLFNPVASGKTITLYTVFVIPWATAAASVTVSMLLTRTSAASVGTLVSAANIGKFTTSSPNSVAEVRTGNPTVTKVGLAIGSFPPAITAAAGGASPAISGTPPSGATFALMPGEGVVMSTASGSVGQLWNLGFVWAEA